MSMFDYDARPVTPGVVLVGTSVSRGGYAIRDFLSRNGYPFEWVDAGQPDAVRAVLGVAEVEPSALPLCILPDGSRLASATVEQVAAGLGMVAAPALPEYDLTVVGAGPGSPSSPPTSGSPQPQRHWNATASGRSAPPQVPARGAWSAPCSPAAPRCTTTPPRPSKPSASLTTSNDPAAISHSGCGCTGWTGKCSAARCGPWPRRPTMSSAACTR